MFERKDLCARYIHCNIINVGVMRTGHFTHSKQMPVCQSFNFYERREPRGNVTIFCNMLHTDWGFLRIIGSAHYNIVNVGGRVRVHITQGKRIDCLPIFYSLQVRRATRQRRSLLQYATWQLRLPRRCRKRSLQVYCPQVALQKRPLFRQQSTSWLPSDCCFLCWWWACNSAILCVDWHLQRIVVSTHFSFDAADAFPNNGNARLPRWARGSSWRPSRRHVFPFPLFKLSLPIWLYFGSRALLHSIFFCPFPQLYEQL